MTRQTLHDRLLWSATTLVAHGIHEVVPTPALPRHLCVHEGETTSRALQAAQIPWAAMVEFALLQHLDFLGLCLRASNSVSR